jgi:ActR/RegA family two-component response regulator
MKGHSDRRKHKRIDVGANAYAAIWPHLSVIGHISDINVEGLSFSYLAREKSTTESFRLVILSASGDFRGITFPVSTVWDEPRQNDFAFSDISMRVCGLQFDPLSDREREAIGHFIDTCQNIEKLKEIESDIDFVLLTGFGSKKVKRAAADLGTAYFKKDEMEGFWAFLTGVEKRGAHVLLVDDEKKFLHTISDRFRLRGFEPLLATSGKEALDIARKHKIHAAVVDLRMPDMDGLVTIKRLKEIQKE